MNKRRDSRFAWLAVLSPGGVPGDWVHLDVYVASPFLTPPVVLATARDNNHDPHRPHNPLIAIALRNADTVDGCA